MQYSATPGSKNAVNTVDNAITTAKVSCLAGVPGCNRRDGGVNGIVVTSQSKVPTWFGRIIGINDADRERDGDGVLAVHASSRSTSWSCSTGRARCASSRRAQNDPNCTDLKNARDGIRTFVSMLDPSIDKVGLALTPPVLDQLDLELRQPVGSGTSRGTGRRNPNVPPRSQSTGREVLRLRRVVAVLRIRQARASRRRRRTTSSPRSRARTATRPTTTSSRTQSGNWNLNDAQSAFLQRLGCTSGAGIDELRAVARGGAVRAQSERPRQRPGRDHLPVGRRREHVAEERAGHPLDEQLEHWGSARAAWASSRRRTSRRAGRSSTRSATTSTRAAARPRSAGSRTRPTGTRTATTRSRVGYDAFTAIQAMASTSPQHFYNKPNPGELNTIFRAIALDLSGSRGRLIDNTSPNLPVSRR